MNQNNGWFSLDNKKSSSGSAQQRRPTDRPPGARPPADNRPTSAARPSPPQRPIPKPVPKPAPPQRPVPKPVPKPTAPPANPGHGGAHSQTVGPRGPVLTQDARLHETLETFANSTFPGRVVHTKGFGAFGQFRTTQSMQEYTTAPVFQQTGQSIPVAVRFSLAVSNKGTPDSGRNVRGFSTKFYTEQGVFDLLCNHIPVFLVRDAIRFPESIRAFQPSPVNNLLDPDRFWSFVSTAPEATHFVTWLYSDVGTIKSLRKIRAYSVNTYVWRNAAGRRTYVKYHWLPVAGQEQIDRQEAAKLIGENPDVCGQDLYDTIAAGTPVEYVLAVQLMDPADAANLPFDPLDDTKTWSETTYPLREVGRMALNRNPDNYEEQIEKLAFAPTNLQEGIEFSADKMLQGRSFIYSDAQRHRLGPDYRKIPINHQENWTPEQMASSGMGEQVEGTITRAEIPKPDNFTQAGERFEALGETDRAHLVDNLAADLAGAKPEHQRIVLEYLRSASQVMGDAVQRQMQQYMQQT